MPCAGAKDMGQLIGRIGTANGKRGQAKAPARDTSLCPGWWGLQNAASSTAPRGRSQNPKTVLASGLSSHRRSVGGL